ncbi:hypothetical protein, partial [Gelidibacter salicanalis]|uniref:hypothetical protein n=1 Tax=Gelidibacter salicanalis TaxID=291193 RepID=UPI001F2D27DE
LVQTCGHSASWDWWTFMTTDSKSFSALPQIQLTGRKSFEAYDQEDICTSSSHIPSDWRQKMK